MNIADALRSHSSALVLGGLWLVTVMADGLVGAEVLVPSPPAAALTYSLRGRGRLGGDRQLDARRDPSRSRPPFPVALGVLAKRLELRGPVALQLRQPRPQLHEALPAQAVTSRATVLLAERHVRV